MNNIQYYELTKADVKQAVDLIELSFRQDPMFLSIFRSIKCRKFFIHYLIKQNNIIGGATTVAISQNKMVAVYLLKPYIANRFINFLKECQAFIVFLPLLFKIGLKSSKQLNDYYKIISKTKPKGPHSYLTLIAVSDHAKGRGVGKMVLQNIIERLQIENKSQALLLDTENKENIGFYEHLGFTLTQTKSVNELNIYSMKKVSSDIQNKN
ncbi:GNAT family N-acetyltransferase [Marinicellulosiphila megalodicopiae]|uniref:GNAT family N-acetyltransferase n=1 Tax=Marinicellulosiphila megalodicopiae TaxID=2724896 RepID=UPI003BB022DE